MVVVFADFGKTAFSYNSKSLLKRSSLRCFFRRNNEKVAIDLFVSFYFCVTSRTTEL